MLENSGSSALTRSFYENKENIDDAFSLSLLEVLEMYHGPVALEALKTGLAAVAPAQYHKLPKPKKSAMEKIRRKMTALSKNGLVTISSEPADGERGSPKHLYELPQKVRDELGNYRKIANQRRHRLLNADIILA